VVLTVGAIPWLIGILNHGWQAFLIGLSVIGFLGAFALVFFGLQAILGHFAFRSRLPREVGIRDGKLSISTRGKTTELDLNRCQWHEGGTLVDNVEMFTSLRRGVVLYTPQGAIAIGHEAGSADRWRAFLSLTDMNVRRPQGCLRLLWLTIVGIVIGTLVGLLFGSLAALITGQSAWQGMLALMGAIDGFGVIIYAAANASYSESDRTRLHPLLMGLSFAVLGASVGGIAGLRGILACASLNLLYGLCLGWMSRRKIRREEEQLASARQWSASGGK
jgi:hypothetical protein